MWRSVCFHGSREFLPLYFYEITSMNTQCTASASWNIFLFMWISYVSYMAGTFSTHPNVFQFLTSLTLKCILNCDRSLFRCLCSWTGMLFFCGVKPIGMNTNQYRSMLSFFDLIYSAGTTQCTLWVPSHPEPHKQGCLTWLNELFLWYVFHMQYCEWVLVYG